MRCLHAIFCLAIQLSSFSRTTLSSLKKYDASEACIQTKEGQYHRSQLKQPQRSRNSNGCTISGCTVLILPSQGTLTTATTRSRGPMAFLASSSLIRSELEGCTRPG